MTKVTRILKWVFSFANLKNQKTPRANLNIEKIHQGIRLCFLPKMLSILRICKIKTLQISVNFTQKSNTHVPISNKIKIIKKTKLKCKDIKEEKKKKKKNNLFPKQMARTPCKN